MLDGAQQQPNAWTCGPAALRNAMLVHGYKADVRLLAKQSITECCAKDKHDMVYGGRCEHGLATAAREHGFILEHILTREIAEAYEIVRDCLPRTPLLLAVEHYSHWITAVKATTRHVWILDPARDVPLNQRITHRKFFQRLTFGLPDEVVFHLYPLRMS